MNLLNKAKNTIPMHTTGQRLKKITLSLSFLFFGVGCSALAQQPAERVITINMSASEQLPADQIIFNITINAEESTPQQAFEVHKKREALLADLLKEYEIPEENIRYQPIRINKQYRNRGNEQVNTTSQSVSLTFSDFSIYEKIQISLIENGFDTFNGSFSSSEIDEGKEKALIAAIDAAKERAKLIAQTAGVQLGPIRTINFSDHQVRYAPMSERMDLVVTASPSSMMDFSQTVTVTANINISFTLE